MIKHLVFICLFPYFCTARICDDTLKGICSTDSNFSDWCAYDKTTRMSSCDTKQYCAKQTQLKGKVNTAGCIGNKCCCNQKNLCNQQFLEVEVQKCVFTTEVPMKHTLIYNDCEEEWCFALITAKMTGSETTTLRGCESRSMLKHLENQIEIKENETDWQLSEPFFKQIRCSQIVSNETLPDTNNTIRACADFNYTDSYRVERQAKLCCCAGSDYCNQPIDWSDSAIVLRNELVIENDDRSISSISTTPIYSLMAGFFAFLLLCKH